MKAEIIVLIAHYNDNERLQRAIASIDEPFPVDVMVVDDGSKIRPNVGELQSKLKSGTVFLEKLPQNVGLYAALNHGLNIIESMSYSYVARLDSDDRNKPNRLAKQKEFLEKHPEISFIGSWIDCVDVNNNFLYQVKYPIHHDVIKRKVYVNSMFAHPTFFYKASILKEIKYPKLEHAEDYGFVFEVLKKHKVANIPEALLYYSISENAISSKYRKEQVEYRIRVIKSNFYWGFYPIYGILRNYPLLFISRETMEKIKKLLRWH